MRCSCHPSVHTHATGDGTGLWHWLWLASSVALEGIHKMSFLFFLLKNPNLQTHSSNLYSFPKKERKEKMSQLAPSLEPYPDKRDVASQFRVTPADSLTSPPTSGGICPLPQEAFFSTSFSSWPDLEAPGNLGSPTLPHHPCQTLSGRRMAQVCLFLLCGSLPTPPIVCDLLIFVCSHPSRNLV